MNRSTQLESENCLFQSFKFKHYLYCLEGTFFQFLTTLLYGMLVLGKIIICSFLSMLVHWVFRVCVCVPWACVHALPLCDPVGCSQPGSSVHGIFQARILEWVAISSSRSSQPRDWTRICISCLSCIGRQILYHWEACFLVSLLDVVFSVWNVLPFCLGNHCCLKWPLLPCVLQEAFLKWRTVYCIRLVQK